MRNIENFKFYKIKNIHLDKRYSPISKNFNITLNKGNYNIDIECINKIRSISKLDKIKTFKEYFYEYSSCLNILENDNVRWDLMLGKRKCFEYLSYIKDMLAFSEKMITTYHVSLYKQRVETYRNLNPVKLDDTILDIPAYNHDSTTGRSSIVSGFNFLIVKKDIRKKFKSKKENHVLVEIDLKSCEPNFYLRAIGKNFKYSDVYLDISKKLNLKFNSRDKFKRGILSVLYGAKDKTSLNILKCNKNMLVKIKEYFEIDKFKLFLSEKFDTEGLIYNYYGRPICYNNSLINYWIQSSSVDYCTFAFKSLIKEYNLKPCYFIHDSMTIEVDNKDINKILKIKKVYDPISNITIPVEINILK